MSNTPTSPLSSAAVQLKKSPACGTGRCTSRKVTRTRFAPSAAQLDSVGIDPSIVHCPWIDTALPTGSKSLSATHPPSDTPRAMSSSFRTR